MINENYTPENIIPDVDDIVTPPPFVDPIGDWPEKIVPLPGALPSAIDLDPKNPARGLSKLEQLAAQLELERAKEARYKAQKEAKEAKAAPTNRPRKAKEANARQISPDTKRSGDELLNRFAYLGNNQWLRRDGPTWATAARELDGAVSSAIADSGYMELPPSPENWMLVWEADTILSHATPRTTLTERGFVLQYMKENLHVHELWSAANWSHGIFRYAGKRVLNRVAYAIPTPIGNVMPLCWDAYTAGLFGATATKVFSEEGATVSRYNQRERVFGLWRELLKKVSAGGLVRGWFQPAGLALASEIGGVGKTRFFHYLALSLGADSPAAAGGYLSGDIIGSSHLLQYPVVELSDFSIPNRDIVQAQNRLLNLISNPSKEIRLMRTETKLIPLSPLVCVSLNSDNPECTKVFSGLPMTIKEKWIVVACENGTAALRAAGFDYADLERTLPEMIGYLLNSKTPDEFLHEEIGGRRTRARFLVGHYFDPVLDLEWGPLGDLAPFWEDLQAVVKADAPQPKDGWYTVSRLRTLLLKIRDSNGDPTYKDMTVKAVGVAAGKINGAISSVFQRKALGDPKNGGRYVYRIA